MTAYAYSTLVNSQSWLGFAALDGVLYANNGVSFGTVDTSTGAFTVKASWDNNLRFMAVAGSRIAIASASYTGRIYSTSTSDGSHYTSTDATDYVGVASDGTNLYATSEGSKYIYRLIGLLGTSTRVAIDLGTANTHRGIIFFNGLMYIGAADGLYSVNREYVKTKVFSTGALGQLATDGNYIYAASPGNGVYRFDPVRGVSELVYSTSSTVFAIGVLNGYIYLGIYGGNIIKLTIPAQPAVPTASVATSTINDDTTVTLSTSTSGATIRYTINGTVPSSTNGSTYSGPITITKTTLLKFYSTIDGLATSGVDCNYTYVCKTPVIDLAGGQYSSPQTVSFSGLSTGVTLKYSLVFAGYPDTPYTGPFTIDSPTEAVNVIAYKTGCTDSNLNLAIFSWKCSDVVSSLESGVLLGRTLISLATPSTGASIYYTLDGTTPTASSKLYSAPFYIDTALTLKAIAIKSGYTSSNVSTYTYSNCSGDYYFLPNSLNATSVFYGLAVDQFGNIFACGPGNDAVIYKVDPSNGTPLYWAYCEKSMKLAAGVSSLDPLDGWRTGVLCTASNVGYLNYYNLKGVTATKGSKIAQYTIAKEDWIGVVVNGIGDKLYAVEGGHIWTDFFPQGDSRTQFSRVQKTNITGITSHETSDSRILYICAPDGIYSVSSNGDYTRLASSVSRAWTSITSDGVSLYGCVDGGYIYKINATTGVDEVVAGDSTTRNWSNIVHFNGTLYATDSVGGGIYRISLTPNATARKVYSGGTWKTAKDWWVYSSNAWKPITKMYKNVSGSWVKIL